MNIWYIKIKYVLVKSTLLYINDNKEEKETGSSNNIENWLHNKVAKNQIKVSSHEIIKKVNFKENKNTDMMIS